MAIGMCASCLRRRSWRRCLLVAGAGGGVIVGANLGAVVASMIGVGVTLGAIGGVVTGDCDGVGVAVLSSRAALRRRTPGFCVRLAYVSAGSSTLGTGSVSGLELGGTIVASTGVGLVALLK